jgi:hypothetical protein
LFNQDVALENKRPSAILRERGSPCGTLNKIRKDAWTNQKLGTGRLKNAKNLEGDLDINQ